MGVGDGAMSLRKLDSRRDWALRSLIKSELAEVVIYQSCSFMVHQSWNVFSVSIDFPSEITTQLMTEMQVVPEPSTSLFESGHVYALG